MNDFLQLRTAKTRNKPRLSTILRHVNQGFLKFTARRGQFLFREDSRASRLSGRKEPSGHQPCPYFSPWARVSSTNQTGQTDISCLAHCFPPSSLKAGPEVPTVGRRQGQSSWNARTTVLKTTVREWGDDTTSSSVSRFFRDENDAQIWKARHNKCWTKATNGRVDGA